MFINPAEYSIVDAILPSLIQVRCSSARLLRIEVSFAGISQTLYSKNFPAALRTAQAVRQLATVFPTRVVPPIFDNVYADLNSITESHRGTSALMVLPGLIGVLFNHDLYPKGAMQMEPLLWCVLPGLDPADYTKTMNAMVVFLNIFQNVPLVAAPLGTSDAEYDEAHAATHVFKEFSAAFIKKLIDCTCTDEF